MVTSDGDGSGDEVGFDEVSGAAVAGVVVPGTGVSVCDEVGVGVGRPPDGVGTGNVGPCVGAGAASGAGVGPSVRSVAGAVGLGLRLGSKGAGL